MVASSHSSAEPAPPLSGLRVLELGQYIAAPAVGQLLADLGADVSKLEPASGDAARSLGWTRDAYGPMFSAYNRGKRSVVFDLRSEAGRAQAKALALASDVVLANARPGALEKQGLGASELLASAPKMVYGRVSAFGQSGPASKRAGFDISAQAESGMMSLNGEAGLPPVRVLNHAADQATEGLILLCTMGQQEILVDRMKSHHRLPRDSVLKQILLAAIAKHAPIVPVTPTVPAASPTPITGTP